MKKLIALMFFALVVTAQPVFQTAPVTLAWDANTEPDLAGYYIYSLQDGATVPERVEVGVSDAPQVTLTIRAGVPHTFYATAFNTAGLESEPSDSVTHRAPIIPPRRPVNLRIVPR